MINPIKAPDYTNPPPSKEFMANTVKKAKCPMLKTLEKVLLDGAERDPEFALTITTVNGVFEGVKALEFKYDYIAHEEYTEAYYAIVKVITNDGDYYINPNKIVSF